MAADAAAKPNNGTVARDLLCKLFGQVGRGADLRQHFDASNVAAIKFTLHPVPKGLTVFAESEWWLNADRRFGTNESERGFFGFFRY